MLVAKCTRAWFSTVWGCPCWFCPNGDYRLWLLETKYRTLQTIKHILKRLLAIMTSSNGNTFCVTGHLWGEPLVTGGFPSQKPMTQPFDVFFDLCLNIQLGKQSRRRWFETPSRSLWRHYNAPIYIDDRVYSLSVSKLWCILYIQ